jgi:hypothetical protein
MARHTEAVREALNEKLVRKHGVSDALSAIAKHGTLSIHINADATNPVLVTAEGPKRKRKAAKKRKRHAPKSGSATPKRRVKRRRALRIPAIVGGKVERKHPKRRKARKAGKRKAARKGRKKARTPAQKAATKRMLAANKAKRGGKKRAKKRGKR